MKKQKNSQGKPGRTARLTQKRLLRVYEVLLKHFGPRNWWPAETQFEVIIGAILTQNTAWSNVEKAIKNLKEAHALTPEGLRALPLPRLLQAIRPSGYYNVKAARIQHLMDVLFHDYNGDLQAFFNLPTDRLRKELLQMRGVGPETADSILLYAAGRPVFVIDAYTLRIMTRHGYLTEGVGYAEAQQWFVKLLPPDMNLYNEFHALFVALGKDWCKAIPRCDGCPLEFL